MTQDGYDRVDEFVDSINESASRVGDVSIYRFNKFRWAIGWIFVIITTVAIAFIIAEFARRFEFEPILGLDVYYIAMGVGLFVGGVFAYYAEEAKITNIKGAIFSEGVNRLIQILAALAVIITLVMANAKGVQGIADFSLRYMNVELQNSVEFKIKQEKMKVHQEISADTKPADIDNSDIEALLRSRKQLEDSRDREIKAIEALRDNYINHHDPKAYRTMIALKKQEAAKKMAAVTARWEKKISKVDWKISKAKERAINLSNSLSEQKAKELDKADKAADELVGYYHKQSQINEQTVKEYADIGLIVAVSGEVIDGVLAMLLFLLVRSNPNTNGTPKVDLGVRPLKPRRVVAKNKDNTIYKKATVSPKARALPKTKIESSKGRVGRELFEEIDRVAHMIAIHKQKYIDGYLKHATQREIIAEFNRQGMSVTPLEIKEYFKKKADYLIFVNQKVGFVYADKALEVA